MIRAGRGSIDIVTTITTDDAKASGIKTAARDRTTITGHENIANIGAASTSARRAKKKTAKSRSYRRLRRAG
jgi:hypothetical protein